MGQPPDFDSRIDWMIEMLRHCSLEIGVTSNESLNLFFQNSFKEFDGTSGNSEGVKGGERRD